MCFEPSKGVGELVTSIIAISGTCADRSPKALPRVFAARNARRAFAFARLAKSSAMICLRTTMTRSRCTAYRDIAIARLKDEDVKCPSVASPPRITSKGEYVPDQLSGKSSRESAYSITCSTNLTGLCGSLAAVCIWWWC